MFILFSGNVTATTKDLWNLVKMLGPDELHELYVELDISSKDVQKAELNAPGQSVNRKALAVLEWWKESSPANATRETLLKALEECRFIDLKQQLEAKWKQ